ncbi:MAG: hypothetical protein AAF327_09530 [Cyanobacteria bacterium P01_A01_bin.37]
MLAGYLRQHSDLNDCSYTMVSQSSSLGFQALILVQIAGTKGWYSKGDRQRVPFSAFSKNDITAIGVIVTQVTVGWGESHQNGETCCTCGISDWPSRNASAIRNEF